MALITKGIVTDFSAPTNGTSTSKAAFEAFNTWAVANQGNDSIELDLEAARTYAFPEAGAGSFWVRGIKNLKVIGRGATLSDGGSGQPAFFLGGAGVTQDNAHSARLASVSSGVSTLTLLDISKASLFTVGRYALIAGLDLQGSFNDPFGFPQNPHFFEYVKITNISGTTITLESELTYSYLSTWPLQNNGSAFEIDAGGPATLYVLASSWDATLEFQNLTIDKAGQQTYAIGRSVTYRNVTCTGTLGIIPTQNLTWQAIGCDLSTCDMEIDKLIGTMVFDDSIANILDFQSSSTALLMMDGSEILTQMAGSPKRSIITNSIIPSDLAPGAFAYGVSTRSAVRENCNIAVFGGGGVLEKASGDHGCVNVYSMASGVIKVPRGSMVTGAADNGSGLVRLAVNSTDGFTTGKYMFVKNVEGTTEANGTWQVTVIDGTHIDLVGTTFANPYTSGGKITAGSSAGDAPRWAVPDAYCLFDGTRYLFKILGVTEDANFIYVTTTLSGGFPTGAVNIRTLPTPSASFSNCTGCPEVVEHSLPLAQEKPLWSYANRTYTKTLTTTADARPKMIGNLVYVKINVTTPYTGALSLTFKLSQFDNWPLIDETDTSRNLAITINAKVAGERVIAISGNTGGQSGDSLPNLTGFASLWFAGESNSGPVMSRDVSGESLGPVITLEILADQGVVFEGDEPIPELEPTHTPVGRPTRSVRRHDPDWWEKRPRAFTRQYFNELKAAEAAQQSALERADRIKSRPAKKALNRAAQEAAEAIALAKENEVELARMTAALEAARGASDLAETIRQADLAIQYAKEIQETEDEAVALLMLH